MTPFENDGLQFQQEGDKTRVISGKLNFLFNSNPEKIIAAYNFFAACARDYFKPRWQSVRGANLNLQEFNEFTKESTLYWMYFYIINRMPVEIKNSDWEHPETRRKIQKTVELRFKRGSVEASQLCAHLMGLSQSEYVNWRKGDELYLNR